MSIKKILGDMDYGLAPESPEEVKNWLLKPICSYRGAFHILKRCIRSQQCEEVTVTARQENLLIQQQQEFLYLSVLKQRSQSYHDKHTQHQLLCCLNQDFLKVFLPVGLVAQSIVGNFF